MSNGTLGTIFFFYSLPLSLFVTFCVYYSFAFFLAMHYAKFSIHHARVHGSSFEQLFRVFPSLAVRVELVDGFSTSAHTKFTYVQWTRTCPGCSMYFSNGCSKSSCAIHQRENKEVSFQWLALFTTHSYRSSSILTLIQNSIYIWVCESTE